MDYPPERPNMKFLVVPMPSVTAQVLINMRDNTPKQFCFVVMWCKN